MLKMRSFCIESLFQFVFYLLVEMHLMCLRNVCLFMFRTLANFENEFPAHKALMRQWETKLNIMDLKEREYISEQSKYKVVSCVSAIFVFINIAVSNGSYCCNSAWPHLYL